MCELCVKPDEKTVLIELRNIHDRPGAKFEAGVDALTKALGYDSSRQQKEISPFKSVRDLERISKDRVEEGLLKLWDAITSTWIRIEKAKGTDTFVLNNRIFINPKTGKPLTRAQWMLIKKDVLKAFDYLYAAEEERIALHALSLGKVIKGLPLGNALAYGYKTLENRVKDTMSMLTGPEWQNAVSFAQQNAGAMIVELKQKQFKVIHDTIQNSIVQHHSTGQLTENLFDAFGGMNRDWRRIAETEINSAQNNGQLLTELERRKPEDEYLFMKGLASSEACPWCRSQVDGRVVVLLDSPPDNGGDTMLVDGETYTVIWPGKNNYGRNRQNWRVAAGSQHPHCVLGDQEVAAALVDSVTEGFYKGNVIEITTRSGCTTTVTENHPIFSPAGFLPAKFFKEGDYVISSTDPQGMMQKINPNYYQRSIAIENLFRAAKQSSSCSARSMSVSSKDFHGDGRCFNSDVDVVDAYGLLGNDIEFSIYGHFDHNPLSQIDLRNSLITQGAVFKGTSGNSATSLSNIGHLGEFSSTLDWGINHSNSHGLSSIPWDDSSFEKSLAEGRACHSEFSSEFLLRFSESVAFKNGGTKFKVERNPSSFLIADEIVSMRNLSYSGKVYDLSEVMYGLYISNGVIVKNCRCTWVKYIPGFEKWDDKFREAMNQANAEYTKKQLIPNNFKARMKSTPWN